ncbi:acyltransferase family protein [Mixta intestinalis]|nr:acyltransferase [Mixta intestinalis]
MLTPLSILYSITIPLAVFYLLTKTAPLNKLMSSETPGKYIYLDPVRGIAALLVFIHHSGMVYNQHVTGKFSPHGIFHYSSLIVRKVYIHFGQTSVMLFFMITGFLFFSKILNFDTPLNVRQFFKSRIKRLLPAMVSGFFLYILVIIILKDETQSNNFLSYIVSWFSFGFIGLPNLSDTIPGWSVTAGVFWTLVLEWKFYILIPFLSYFISNGKTAIIFLISTLGLIIYLYNINYLTEKEVSIYACFMSGLAIALIIKSYPLIMQKWLGNPFAAIFCMALYIYSFLNTANSYTLQITFSSFIFILIVISGNSFFGVLKLKPLHWAGKSSYGIYIMHALIMHLVFSLISNNIGYYKSIFISTVILCIVTLLNYIFVERKYMCISR